MPKLKVSDIEMYYEETGQGDPLLLISGWSTAARSFRGHLDAFAKHYRCIRVDKRGIGETDAPDAPYSIRMMADDVNDRLDALGLREVRVLGAGGMGALVAMELAINHPEKLRSLVLGSPCLKVDNFFRQLMLVWKDLWKINTELWAREVTMWCFTPETFNQRPDLPESSWKARAAEKTFAKPWAYDRIIDAYLDHDATDRVHLIRCPTLVTVGGFEDLITGPRYAREVYARIPGAKLHIFENTSHSFPAEAQEEWGAVIEKWFAKT